MESQPQNPEFRNNPKKLKPMRKLTSDKRFDGNAMYTILKTLI